MQAGALAFRSAIDQAPSFHRSGSTPNCCQRCPSVLPSFPWKTKFVSGTMSNTDGVERSDLRKKYCTCEPGVSRPSGMILVCSLVIVTPSQPERPGPTGYKPQPVPSHVILVEFVAPPGIGMTHMFFRIPSDTYLPSLSWYVPR